MPAERLSMRKVREVLRLKYACGASERVIARSVGIGRTAIGEYVRRAAVIGITWPVPEELDDAALERKLFAPSGYNRPRSKPLPEWGHIHAELRRRGVTLRSCPNNGRIPRLDLAKQRRRQRKRLFNRRCPRPRPAFPWAMELGPAQN
jgi:transposase